MALNDRDGDILRHLTMYCDDVLETVDRFGNTFEAFRADKAYRNACAMCILQIGELVGHLSPQFRASHAQMPWNEIKAMRNIVVHAYGSVSAQMTWETIEQDIPALKAYCDDILRKAE